MALKVNEGDLKCPICMELAKEAVESDCCNHAFCAVCSAECMKKWNKCPLCRKQPFRTTPSIFTRRLIANMPVTCPDCGERCERGNLNQHVQICPRRPIRCEAPGCGQSFQRTEEDAFLAHLVDRHRAALVANHSRLFDEPRNAPAAATASSMSGAATDHFMPPRMLTPPSQAANGNDNQPLYEHELTDFSVNRRGVRVRCSQSNGKFYCNEHVLPCQCCDGICGPTSGCNCPDCMILDMAARGLPRGHLVNRAGEITSRASDGRFYCGNTLQGPLGRSFVCAFERHSQCRACRSLELPCYRAVAGVDTESPTTPMPYVPPGGPEAGNFFGNNQQFNRPAVEPFAAFQAALNERQHAEEDDSERPNSSQVQEAMALQFQQMMLNQLLRAQTENSNSDDSSAQPPCRVS